MREWQLKPGDPMAPRIAADARAGRTDYHDDQAWGLRLGGPTEPALSLETRYGGRVGLARIVPVWGVGGRKVYETQGYQAPPVLAAFAPDLLRVRAGLTSSLALTAEFWTMESQAVGGRFTVRNSGDRPQSLRLDLTAQVARQDKALPMLFLTLEGGLVALQMGRLPHLQPVLLLEGARETGATAQLSRAQTVPPGEAVTFRWVLAARPLRDESLALAHRWLAVEDWDAHLAAIHARAEAAPQVETGHADWDLALAWSQQLVLRGFLAASGSLPHPSFVSTRKPNQGYALGGAHSGGFASPWGGQTVPDALTIAGTVALAAPELAQGMVRNFLSVQRDDGWIDARPGLDGQRANVLALPLLATLAQTVYQFTHDQAFLAGCLDGLLAFFGRWFAPDVDADGDGVPEWQHPGQGAFAEGPTLARGSRWAQGVDLSTVEAPDLLAYLIREARALLDLGALLDRPDVVEAITPRLDALIAALEEFWDEARGVYTYRDRDAHACPSGETIFSGHGESVLAERTELGQPGRLILRATGGLDRKPALSCTAEGEDAAGNPAREEVPGEAFDWYRGAGTATTRTVWRAVTGLRFAGLSRVFKVEARTVDLSAHDIALLMPLWSGALDEARVAHLVAHLTDPAAYWRPFGAPGCPANAPHYDSTPHTGCGGVWPDWNARLGLALIEGGFVQESAELFRRILAAQTRSLAEAGTFRTLYHAESGEGLGDSDVLSGAVSWGWFARLFGAFALDAWRAVILGPYAFSGETMTWTQHGVRITRSDGGTEIAFPSGQMVTLPADAAAQTVCDPASESVAAPPPLPPDSDLPPADQTAVQ
ncbi:MAG: hypothetical protein HRF48_07350 [Chloroflexota bacterium]|jgi:hypothetical protein